jgi:soluble lytic murein transglycosylase-like protein
MAKTWPKGGATTERWRRKLERIATWVPVDALLAWIDTESGGRPDVTTSLGERGLFQVHPDEVEMLGLTQDEFTRLTTDPDLALRVGVRQAKLYARQAKSDLAKAGVEWHGRDFWKLVKLYHGAYAMPRAALQAFARTYGRGPDSWAELYAFTLREAAAGRDLITNNPQLSKTLRQLTNFVMANAEKTGEASELPVFRSDRVAQVADLLRRAGIMI